MRHLYCFLFHRQLPPRTVVLHRLRRRLACPCAPGPGYCGRVHAGCLRGLRNRAGRVQRRAQSRPPTGQLPAHSGTVPAGQQPKEHVVPPDAAGIPGLARLYWRSGRTARDVQPEAVADAGPAYAQLRSGAVGTIQDGRPARPKVGLVRQPMPVAGLLAEVAEDAALVGGVREILPGHIRDVQVVLDAPKA